MFISAFDRIQEKKMYDDSLRLWLWNHRGETQRFLDNNINYFDHQRITKYFLKKPLIARWVLNDFLTPSQEKIDFFIDLFLDFGTSIVLGQKGSGKTALAHWIVQEVLKREPNKIIAFVMCNAPLPDIQNIIHITKPEEAPYGALVIVDEAGITHSARRSMKKENVEMSAFLMISRHNDNHVIFLSQHSALADINILRLCDNMIFKRLSYEELNNPSDHTNKMMEVIRFLAPQEDKDTLFTDGIHWFKIETGLPYWWSEAISKSFANLSKIDAVDFVVQKYNEGVRLDDIVRDLHIRGIDWGKIQIQSMLNHPEKKKELFRKLKAKGLLKD